VLWLCCLELGGFLKIWNWSPREIAPWPERRELIIRVRAKIQAQDSSKGLQSCFQAAVFYGVHANDYRVVGFGFLRCIWLHGWLTSL